MLIYTKLQPFPGIIDSIKVKGKIKKLIENAWYDPKYRDTFR